MKNNEQQIKTVFNGDLDHVFNELILSGIANNQDRMKLEEYHCKIITETRQRKFEKKEVIYHGGRGFFGGINHCHSTIRHIKFKETQTISGWMVDPGSWETCIIEEYDENGFVFPYIREI